MEQAVGGKKEHKDLVAQVVEMDLEEVHMGADMTLGYITLDIQDLTKGISE